MRVVRGDLLEARTDYLIQQCNCLTVRSHGLSTAIEEKYRYAAIYGRRKSLGNRNIAITQDRAVPGTYFAAIPPEGEIGPKILCLFGQWRPGKIAAPYFDKYPESEPAETQAQRLLWFKVALTSFGESLVSRADRKKHKIAFPYKIGCGLAGGKWSDYLTILGEFQETYKTLVEITLFKQ